MALFLGLTSVGCSCEQSKSREAPPHEGGEGGDAGQGGSGGSLADAGRSGGPLSRGGEGGTEEPSTGDGAAGTTTVPEAGNAGQAGHGGELGCRGAREGTVCDDGDSCTTADRCSNGECVGTPFESSAAELGSVSVFGPGLLAPKVSSRSYELSGLGAFLSEDRLIVADSRGGAGGVELSLVGVNTDLLAALDSIASPLPWRVHPVSSWVHSRQPLLSLAALSPDRFAVATSGNIELYGVADERLALLSRLATEGMFALVGQQDRLWTCGRVLGTFHVEEPGTLKSDGYSNGVPGRCMALALGGDGETLYAAGPGGLVTYDIATARVPATFRERILDEPLAAVEAARDRVAIQRIEATSTIGSVVVYAENAWSEPLALFPKWDPAGAPLGFSLVGSGIVIIRSVIDEATYAIVAEYQELDATGATFKSRLEIQSQFPTELAFNDGVRPAAFDRYVMLQPTRRILHVDDQGILSEVTGTAQGKLETLRRHGSDALVAHSASSAHQLDLSDPHRPRIVAGGLLPTDTQPLQLTFDPDQGELPELGATRWLSAPTDHISLIGVNDDGAPAPSGKVAIHGGPALLARAGASLYGFRAAELGTASAVLRYSLLGLDASADAIQELEPIVEQPLDIRADAQPFVDPAGTSVFVLDREPSSDAGRNAEMRLRRYIPGPDDQLVAAGERRLPGVRGIGAAEGGYVLVLADSRTVLLLENTSDLTTIGQFTSDEPVTLQRLVRLTRTEADLATLDAGRAGLLVLKMPDLERIVHYELPDSPLAVADVGKSLAVATGGKLVTLSPQCPLEPANECPEPGTRRCSDAHNVEICSESTGRWERIESCVDSCDAGMCRTVASVELGQRHGCALLSDHSVRCWGRADLVGAELPNTQLSTDAVPVRARDGSQFVAEEIALGALHSCARTAQGTVQCWGYSGYGELGDGSAGPGAAHQPAPALNDDRSPLTGVVQVAAGGHTTCAVLDDGTARCFGWGAEGQLGNGELGKVANRATAAPVLDPDAPDRPLADVAEVAVGYLHACARLRDGTVRCWGNNELGQLGNQRSGSGTQSALPEVVLDAAGAAPLSDVVRISAGYTHNCALLASGAAVCWGDGGRGELGSALPEGMSASALPLPVTTNGTAVSEIRAGWRVTCLRFIDGKVQCVGAGERGERGDGVTGNNHYGPEASAVLESSGGFVQVSPGFHALCLRTGLRGLVCAGTGSAQHVHGSDSSVPSSLRW